MNCREALEQLHAYFDGELELSRSLEVERHMNECQSCARALQAQATLRTTLREAAPYYRAPANLGKRVRSSLREEARAEKPARVAPWGWIALAALWSRPNMFGTPTFAVKSSISLFMSTPVPGIVTPLP